MDIFWVEALGYIAVVFLILSFQFNNRSKILVLLSTAMLFLATHQFFLGALAGASANGLTIVRNLFFWNKKTNSWSSHFLWPYFFSLLLVLLAIVFWEDWYSLFPALAVICSTFALWADQPKTIRVLSLLGPLLWIPYALAIDSLPTLLLQLSIISSILVAMFRFDRKQLS